MQVTTLCESHYEELVGMVSSSAGSILGDSFIFEKVQHMYHLATEGYGGTFEPELRENQAKSIYHLLGGKDLLCVLATNSGKTLIQIAPLVMLTHVIE
jgi:superfamily II helicase